MRTTVDRFVLGLVVLAWAPGAVAQAPQGFRTHKDSESGVEFFHPIEFAEIPLPPTELAAKAKYVRIQPPDAIKDTGFKPWFEVYVLDAGKGGTTPGPDDPKEEPASKPSGPTSIREAMLDAARIEGFDEFKKKRLASWNLTPIGLPNAPVKEYSLSPKRQGAPVDTSGDPNAWRRQTGFVAVKTDSGRHLIVYGVTLQRMEQTFQAEMRRVHRSLKLKESDGAAAALQAYYEKPDRRGLRAQSRRIEVRMGLAKGWKAYDTENFIIVSNADNERLINKTARDLEAIRPLYVKLFPPTRPVEAVSIVRLCRDQKQYMTYGAPGGSGGFWHAGNEELVLFDYAKTQLDPERSSGRRLTDKDSYIVLYHEAFHQYIYYAVGEISPHDWFNEGHGDYFSGAIIADDGRIVRVGPSPWRIHRAKDMAEAKKPGWVPPAKLVRALRQEYYDPRVIGNYYACGWAFVHFLRESPEVAKNPQWASILTTYFDTLKSEYASRLEKLGEQPDLMQKRQAGEAARTEAVEKAFADVDFERLETAWKSYIIKMKDPWPELRGK